MVCSHVVKVVWAFTVMRVALTDYLVRLLI